MPRNNSIRMIAESLTEDPDYYRGDPRYFTEDADALLNEAISEALFGLLGPKKAKHPLTQLVDANYVKQYARAHRMDYEKAMGEAVRGIHQEFIKYCQYNRLEEDDPTSMEEFVAYKTGKKLPKSRERDPRELDQRGGDFAGGDFGTRDHKIRHESRRRGRRGILK